MPKHAARNSTVEPNSKGSLEKASQVGILRPIGFSRSKASIHS